MKANLHQFVMVIATVCSIATTAVAQVPADSLFDSIQSATVQPGTTQSRVAPQLQLAPPTQIAPQVIPELETAPNFDPRFQNGPQPYIQQPQPIYSDPNGLSHQPQFQPQVQSYIQPQFQPQVQPAIEPFVLPATCDRLPKLQFSGREIYGIGMQVVAVDYGGVAQQIGLEPGDIIVQIDGRPIRCSHDYETALFNAAVYNEGHVDLVVRNIRYRPGCSVNPKFVSLHADLPTRCIVPAVAAR